MIVCKFGGTSVAEKESAQKIKDILSKNNNRKIVVVSALGRSKKYNFKITDKLFEVYYALINNDKYLSLVDEIFLRYEKLSAELNVKINWAKHKKEFLNSLNRNKISKEYIVSRGEYYSAILYAKYLKFKFIDARDYIKFNKNGKINEKLTNNALKTLKINKKYVIGGYYGSRKDESICVFDRGGSDITGAIICKFLNFEIYENYTDVNGVYDKNPNLFLNAENLPILSFSTAIKMAECGNEIVHTDALKIIKNSNSIILVKNTKNYNKLGTIIIDKYKEESQKLYVCISKAKLICYNELFSEKFCRAKRDIEILKIIKNNKVYILAKNIFLQEKVLTEIGNMNYLVDASVVSLFCSDITMSKKNIKIIKKMHNKLKKYAIYSHFCSFKNNFNIIFNNANLSIVIKIINNYIKN